MKTIEKPKRFVIVLDPPRPKEGARLSDLPPLEPAHIVWALIPIAKDL